MKSHILIFLFISVFLINCNNSKLIKRTPKTDYTFKDSVCFSRYKGYFNLKSLSISNYYELIDSTTIKNDYKILILSPKILTPSLSTCRNAKYKIINNRLLITIHGKDVKIYDNVISNSIGYGTSGSELIGEYKQDFKLTNQTGQSCKKSYSINIFNNQKSFYIKDIVIERNCNDDFYSKDYSFDDYSFPLEKFNRKMVDSLFILNDIKLNGHKSN